MILFKFITKIPKNKMKSLFNYQIITDKLKIYKIFELFFLNLFIFYLKLKIKIQLCIEWNKTLFKLWYMNVCFIKIWIKIPNDEGDPNWCEIIAVFKLEFIKTRIELSQWWKGDTLRDI